MVTQYAMLGGAAVRRTMKAPAINQFLKLDPLTLFDLFIITVTPCSLFLTMHYSKGRASWA